MEVVAVTIVPGRVRLRVQGLYQEAELARGIEQAIAFLRGVRRVQANAASGRVLVEFNPAEIALATIVSALVSARPTPRPTAPTSGNSEPGFAGAVLRLVLSGTVLVGLFVGRLIAGAPLLAATPLIGVGSLATLFAGYPIFRNGLRALVRERRADMDTLISSATFASLLLRESLTGLVVVWLINVGDLLQSLTMRRAQRAIRDLLSPGDQWVWIIVSGQELRVPLSDVHIGDHVVAHEGDKIAVDGVVVEGEAAVNQAAITGEALPVSRRAGHNVFAGTVVEAGHMVVRANAVGDNTAVGRIIRQIEQARERRAPIQCAADHFADRFVPFSFLLSALVFLLTRDFRRSMSMLVIACPCAAGLSTPTATGAAIGNAAGRGILIKGGLYLEAAGCLDAVVFDKTGTLTTSVPHITRVLALNPGYSPQRVLALAAAAERHSCHPFGAAVRRHADEWGVDAPPASSYETFIGRGVRARVDGVTVTVGNRSLLAQMGIVLPTLDEASRGGEAALWVVLDHIVVGMLGVDDTLRPEARRAVEELVASGIRRLILATGDEAAAAKHVAHCLSLHEYRAGMLPEEKLAMIRDLQSTGRRVAMVGDGINDGPALAVADVGIALGTAGSDVAIEAADVALAGDDLRQVPAIVRLSRHTLGLVHWNFKMAIGVNALGIALSALGLMSPLAGAIVHNLSTVAVVLNSARLIGYRDCQPEQLPSGKRHKAR